MNLKLKNFTRIIIFFLVISFSSYFIPQNVSAKTLKESNGNVTQVNFNNKNYTITIIKDDKNIREVKVKDGNDTYIDTYNKFTKQINQKTLDKEGNVTKSVTNKYNTATNSVNNSVKLASANGLIRSNATSFFNCSYIYFTDGNWWVITNTSGTSKQRTENSSNSSNLLSFKQAVDSCRYNEVGALCFGTASAISGVIAVIAAPSGLGGIIATCAAIGLGVTCAYYIYCAYENSLDANMYYARV